MVLGYYDALPAQASYAWVPTGHTDPWVDYAARMTFDHDYDGTGNWPFNTAYAAPRAGKAFVTRLRSLREAERFIEAGIPLVASISFGPASSTAPRSRLDQRPPARDRRLHRRPATWSSTTRPPPPRRRAPHLRPRPVRATPGCPRSGGTVYVIRDAAHPLPAGDHGNW